MSAGAKGRKALGACECFGGNCSGAGPHGTGDEDNCTAAATVTLACEGMRVVLCAPCGQMWEGDGDWSLVPGSGKGA